MSSSGDLSFGSSLTFPHWPLGLGWEHPSRGTGQEQAVQRGKHIIFSALMEKAARKLDSKKGTGSMGAARVLESN